MIRIRIKLSRLLGDRRMKQKQLEELTGIRAATINNYYQENTDRVSLVFLATLIADVQTRKWTHFHEKTIYRGGMAGR